MIISGKEIEKPPVGENAETKGENVFDDSTIGGVSRITPSKLSTWICGSAKA